MPFRFLPGKPSWYASDSPTSSFSVVFEDDGDTGYIYPYDRDAAGGQGAILDACHVYDARNVRDRDIESEVEIVWHPSGVRAAAYINQYAHAVVDFSSQRAYCRSNWPPPTGPWNRGEQSRVAWHDELLVQFEANEA